MNEPEKNDTANSTDTIEPEEPVTDGGSITEQDDRDSIFEEQPGEPTDIDLESLRGNFTYSVENHCFHTDVRGCQEGMAIRVRSTERLPAPMVPSVYYYRQIGDIPGAFLLSSEAEGPPLTITNEGAGLQIMEPLIRLRTFSFRAFMRSGKELGLTAVVGSMEDMEAAPGDVILHEAMIVAWMQSSPPAEVRRVFKAYKTDSEAVEDAVEEFEDNLQFNDEAITKLLTEVCRVIILAKRTWFKIIARQNSAGKVPKAPADLPKNS
ncbi:MAG: hypothetical protein ACTSU8_05785 [Alphaproteobacteria bacterium]